MKIALGILKNGRTGTIIASSGKSILYEGRFCLENFSEKLLHCVSVLGVSKDDVEKIYLSAPFFSERQDCVFPIIHFRIAPELFGDVPAYPYYLLNNVKILQSTPENLAEKIEENLSLIKNASVISTISPFGLVYPKQESKVVSIMVNFGKEKILTSRDYPHLGFYQREKVLIIAGNFLVSALPLIYQIKSFFSPLNPGIYWVENEAVFLEADFLPGSCGVYHEVAPLIQIARGCAVIHDCGYALALFKMGSTFKLFQIEGTRVNELPLQFNLNSTAFIQLQRQLYDIKNRYSKDLCGTIPVFNFSRYDFADCDPFRFYKVDFMKLKLLRYIGLIFAPKSLASGTICEQKNLFDIKKNLFRKLYLVSRRYDLLKSPLAFSQEIPIRYLTSSFIILKVELRERDGEIEGIKRQRRR